MESSLSSLWAKRRMPRSKRNDEGFAARGLQFRCNGRELLIRARLILAMRVGVHGGTEEFIEERVTGIVI